MARGHLAKLLKSKRQQRHPTKAPNPAQASLGKRSSGDSRQKQLDRAIKRRKGQANHSRVLSEASGTLASGSRQQIQDAEVDVLSEQLAGDKTPYEALVNLFSAKGGQYSHVLQQRRKEQEGHDDEQDEDEDVIDQDEGESDLGSESTGGRASEDAKDDSHGHRANGGPASGKLGRRHASGALDAKADGHTSDQDDLQSDGGHDDDDNGASGSSGSDDDAHAANAHDAAHADGLTETADASTSHAGAGDGRLQRRLRRQQQAAAATAPDAAPAVGVPAPEDTWQAHVGRELQEGEAAALQRNKMKYEDVEHDDHKGVWRHAHWQAAGRPPQQGLPAAPAQLSAYSIKERLQARWAEVHQEDQQQAAAAAALSAGSLEPPSSSGSKAAAAASGADPNTFITVQQRAFFAALHSYADIFLPVRPYPAHLDMPDHYMDAYLLHCLNHVAKTADCIKKNNDRIAAAVAAAKAAGSADGASAVATTDVPRDQGFTRPKVLILLPQRNFAFKLVRRLVALAMKETRADSVQGKEKFVEHFTDPEADDESELSERTKARLAAKPAEHRALFHGNIDDHFRLGIKITRGAIRLFADLFQSDILVASPIALATKLAEDKNKGSEASSDFLSSIELLVIDRADILTMQNWAHVETVLDALNRLPKEQHGTDIMRVREWALSGYARHYRQTVLLSSFASVDMNMLFNRQCANHEGKLRLVLEHPGVLTAVVPQVQQLFERVSCQSPVEVADARFAFFERNIWPRIKEASTPGLLIFVAHYFDYVRLRNLLKAQDVDFTSICEYTAPRDVIAARSQFFHKQRRVLLYTERVHFYNRHRIRGINDILFYSLPDHGYFYSEILNLLEGGGSARAGSGAATTASGANLATVTTLFCKYDALQLERVVGSGRARKMLAASSGTFMFC